MQGDDDKHRAHARDKGPDEERRVGNAPISEIPTDPSLPTRSAKQAVRALDPATEDRDLGILAEPTDPSHASYPSGAQPVPQVSHISQISHPANISSVRSPTAIDKSRKKERPNTGARVPPAAKTELESPNAIDTPNPDAKDEHIGRTFGGKYRIDKLVAKGGMGRVYRGTQFPLERVVAIKILNKEFQRTDPQFVRRFFLEASTAAKLSHPHTITVFDYGEADNGDLYIAMEYLKGRPLSRVITNEGPFPADRALRIGIQVCRAVREAHLFGIIHRDLKPGNIFLVDEGDEGDYAKVLDFGLVKLFRPGSDSDKNASGMLGEGDPELTRTGTLLGSPKYMSPEQIQGHHLDPRTDIYSLGVILFQMIAGKPPYSGATGVDVIYKHVHAPIPTIAEIAPGVHCPEPLASIIERCLSKKREERYASMDELLVYLKEALRIVSGSPMSASDSFAEGGETLRPDTPPPHAPGERSEASRSQKIDRSGSLASIGSGSSSHGSGRVRVTPASDGGLEPLEARFKDPGVEETTPIGGLRADGRDAGRSSRTSRVPLALAATGFIVALITLGYVTLVRPRLEQANNTTATSASPGLVPTRPFAPAPTAPVQPSTAGTAAPAEVEMLFVSAPSGARVFEGTTLLGVTPFAKKLAVNASADEPRELVFRYPGYKDEVKTVLVDGKVAKVEAMLAVAEESDSGDGEPGGKSNAKRKRGTPAKTKKEQSPNQYRQNPY